MTTMQRTLGASLAVMTTLFLTGCSGPNLIDRLNNFWGRGICGAILIILDLIAIVEVFGSERSTGDKVLWTLLIVFFPVGGLIIYYLLGRG